MTLNSKDDAFRDAGKSLAGLPTAALLVVILINYGMCVAGLMNLQLTSGYRAVCAFIALTFGYGISGKFMWMIVYKLTGMPVHRCMYYGTFVGHALGALVGASAGYYFSR